MRWDGARAAERDDATRRAYRGDMSAENVPEAVKQFVTCLYGHVRDKNGAFDGRRECDGRCDVGDVMRFFFGFFTSTLCLVG